MNEEIKRLRDLHSPAIHLWVDERNEDGDFPAAEENMMDWAAAWVCPKGDSKRLISPMRVGIDYWINNRPVAPKATHIVYATYPE